MSLSRTLLILSVSLALLAAACGGGDDAADTTTPTPAAAGVQEDPTEDPATEPPATDDPTSEDSAPDDQVTEGPAGSDPAAPDVAGAGGGGSELASEATCDQLLGQTFAGVGPLDLLSASNQDGILVCRYLEPENAFQSIRVTLHFEADEFFRSSVTDPAPEAEVLDGYGEAAIMEPEDGFSAVYPSALLVSIEATRNTDEPGVTELDRDATIALADAVDALITQG